MPGARRLYGAGITTVEAGIAVAERGGPALGSELYFRTGICGHLHFLRGSCRLGAGAVILTAAGARQIGAVYGHTLLVDTHARTLRVRVVGIISTPPLDLPYWWGLGATDFPIGQGAAGNSPPPTDPLIASAATVLSAGAADSPGAYVQLPLRPGAVNLADEAAVRPALASTTRQMLARGIHASSGLSSLLDDADHQRHVMATIVAIAATQLVVLAVWVLGSLLVRSSDARRSEARVARLRGFPGRSMLWVTAAEPALLCLVGTVLGVALAWLAIVVARARLLEHSATIAFDGWTIAALALTLVAIAGALGIGALRLLRSADLAASSARRQRGVSAASLAADAVLVVLAVVALVALGTTGALRGRSDPLASAAPGLIALGTAVLAVQLILFGCRLGVSLTAGSASVGRFLALRQTARRPGVLRQARVLIIALCLACFATAAWSVARGNRATAADFSTGASRIVSVAPGTASALERAVDRADPRARWAMAAVQLETSNTTLLAVDAPRLPVTASWPRAISGRSVRAIAHRLAPPSHPSIELPEAPVAIRARVSGTGAAARHLRDAELSLWVFNQQGGSTIVPFGSLRGGEATYHGSLAAVCVGGCRVAGLGLLPAPGESAPPSGAIRLQITRITSSRRHSLDADLVPGGWRSTDSG